MIDYEMRRGYFARAAAVLEAVTQNRTRAPSRILSGLGISYTFLKTLITAGLLQVRGEKKHRRLTLTENGRQFLTHYKICQKLFPN